MAASSMIYRSPLESGLILWLPSSATCLTCRTTSSIIRSPSSHNHHLKVDVVGNYEIRKTASGSRGAGMQTRLWSDKDRAASKKGHLNGSNTIAFFCRIIVDLQGLLKSESWLKTGTWKAYLTIDAHVGLWDKVCWAICYDMIVHRRKAQKHDLAYFAGSHRPRIPREQFWRFLFWIILWSFVDAFCRNRNRSFGHELAPVIARKLSIFFVVQSVSFSKSAVNKSYTVASGSCHNPTS